VFEDRKLLVQLLPPCNLRLFSDSCSEPVIPQSHNQNEVFHGPYLSHLCVYLVSSVVVLLTRESTSRNQDRSLLLRLPPELRNMILKYSLGGTTVVMEPHSPKGWFGAIRCFKFRHHHSKPKARYEAVRQLCALSLSCRSIHLETALLPFALNDFNVGDPWPRRDIPEQYLGMMSSEQRGALQCLLVLDWTVNDSSF
jgi:hypothetical protein